MAGNGQETLLICKGNQMSHESRSIADSLIEELGIEGAIRAVQEKTQEAHDAGDFYSLSVWREIRTVIRGQKIKPSKT